MKTDADFQNAGKKMPYTVPDGFFERITGDTLEEAKLRQKAKRRKIFLWGSLSAVASVAALIMVGVVVFSVSPGKTGRKSVQNVPAVSRCDSPEKVATFPEQSSGRRIFVPGERNAGETTPVAGSEDIGMAEVLASLSDEELLQLAVRLKSDMFMEFTNME